MNKQYELKNIIDFNGDIPPNLTQKISRQEILALEVMESFLGCTLDIRGTRFIPTNLELYYGSIGDLAHDWYRANFPNKYVIKSKSSKENAIIQNLKGPRIYFNHKSSSYEFNFKTTRSNLCFFHFCGFAILFIQRFYSK